MKNKHESRRARIYRFLERKKLGKVRLSDYFTARRYARYVDGYERILHADEGHACHDHVHGGLHLESALAVVARADDASQRGRERAASRENGLKSVLAKAAALSPLWRERKRE